MQPQKNKSKKSDATNESPQHWKHHMRGLLGVDTISMTYRDKMTEHQAKTTAT
jgi:hypothetical protein